jgi:hypothetical protein
MNRLVKYVTLLFAFVDDDIMQGSKSVYMFTSFHEPANEGLRFLYSYDAWHWTDLNHVF